MANKITYRRYIIKSMKVAGAWQARAILRQSAVGVLQTGATEEEAIAAVKGELDAMRAERSAARGPSGIPTAAEFTAALDVIDITSAQLAMLNAHVGAPEHTLTATELARAGGYKGYSPANSQYGALAARFAEELEWEPPVVDGVQTWTFTLATGVDDNECRETSEWRWKMRPEVIKALQRES